MSTENIPPTIQLNATLSQEVITLRQRVAQLEQEVENLRQTETAPEKTNQKPQAQQKDYFVEQAKERVYQGLEVDHQPWLLQNVIDASSSWIFAKDQNFRYLLVNRSYAEAIGKTIDEMLGKDDLELGFPSDLVLGNPKRGIRGFREDDRVALGGAPIHNPHDACTVADGSLHIFDTHKTPLRDATGNVIGILGIATDVTERKQLEAALQESETRFQAFIDHNPVAAWITDTNGKVLYVSQTYLRTFQLPTQDLVGKSVFDIYPAEIAEQFLDNIQAVSQSNKTIESLEIAPRPDGSLGYFLVYKFPIVSLSDCLLVGGVAIDISERKQMETALAESEAKFRRLVEDADDVIWTATLDGILTYTSPSFKGTFGYDVTEPLNQSFLPLVHPDDLSAVTDFLNAVIETGRNKSGIAFRHATKEGSWIWVTSNVSPIKDADGKVIGLQGILRDINEAKQVEAARLQAEQQLQEKTQSLEHALEELKQTQLQMIQSEKMSSLGQMVAGVAHEINNPVNFIHGNLVYVKEYIQDLVDVVSLYQHHYPQPMLEIQDAIAAIDLEFLTEDLTKVLQSMQLGTERIREIVLSLRNFSRLDEAEVKDVNIHDGIDSTITILHNRLKGKAERPEIQVIKEYGNLPLVECYAGQLNQVFMNIISNAIDAIEEHSRHRSYKDMMSEPGIISIRTEMSQDNQVRICVADNGLGIKEEVHKRLFDPFFTTKAVGKGTGLGLSISYQIITEKHKGSLWCESKPGQGAKFIIEIPVGLQK